MRTKKILRAFLAVMVLLLFAYQGVMAAERIVKLDVPGCG